MFNLVTIITAVITATLLLGGFSAGRGIERTACKLESANERNRLLGEWQERVLDEIALADDIDRRAVLRDNELNNKLQETQHALKTATTGRACLGGAALRLLDQSTGLRPPAGAAYPGALSDRSAAAAAHSTDGADSEATDTDVAGWITLAGDYYERCRERIRDIRRIESGER